MKRRACSFLFLALIFLASQSALAAHGELHASKDTLQCQLCAGNSHPDNGLLPSGSLLYFSGTRAAVAEPPAIPALRLPWYKIYDSRAPPSC